MARSPGYVADTGAKPSGECKLCRTGVRRWLETVVTPSNPPGRTTERAFVHHTGDHSFERCEDQTFEHNLKWGCQG